MTDQQAQCPHGRIYGTCLMCYHDLVGEQQSEIERLQVRVNGYADANVELRAALKVAQQSLLEFSHAQEYGPSWYTRGANGMYQQVSMHLRRGLEAVQGALGPYDDNGEYLKERPSAELSINVTDAARWSFAKSVICHSFDGEHRTHYLKASGRENFEETVDRLIGEKSAAEPECVHPNTSWNSIKTLKGQSTSYRCDDCGKQWVEVTEDGPGPVGYLRDEAEKIGDGVALTSIAHPRSPWYRRFWMWFRAPRLSQDSLEDIEIAIPDRIAPVPTKGLRVMLANPTGDPGHVLFDAPGRKGQIPTTQEAQTNLEYINSLLEADERHRG